VNGQRTHDARSGRRGSARWLVAPAAVVVSTVLVTVLAGVASAAGRTILSDGAGWLTYTGVGGVTFRHPALWTVSHANAGPLYVFIDPASETPFRRNINLVLQTSAQPLTAAGYLKTDLGEIRQDRGTISHQYTVSFDGTPGYRVIWAATISGSPYEFLSQWTIRHGQAWLVTYSADPPRFGSALPTVERLLAGLRLPA